MSTAEMEQLKKIAETANANIDQLVSVITAHGEKPDMKTMVRLRPPSAPTKPEWLLSFVVSMGTVM
jgi:hypothetical protein